MTDHPHKWVPSKLGHGESQCAYCHATNRELAATGEMDHCAWHPARLTPDTHPQKFIILGRRRQDVEKRYDEPVGPVQHLPTMEDGWGPVYRVIGEGEEYRSCKQCFPNSHIDENISRNPCEPTQKA